MQPCPRRPVWPYFWYQPACLGPMTPPSLSTMRRIRFRYGVGSARDRICVCDTSCSRRRSPFRDRTFGFGPTTPSSMAVQFATTTLGVRPRRERPDECRECAVRPMTCQRGSPPPPQQRPFNPWRVISLTVIPTGRNSSCGASVSAASCSGPDNRGRDRSGGAELSVGFQPQRFVPANCASKVGVVQYACRPARYFVAQAVKMRVGRDDALRTSCDKNRMRRLANRSWKVLHRPGVERRRRAGLAAPSTAKSPPHPRASPRPVPAGGAGGAHRTRLAGNQHVHGFAGCFRRYPGPLAQR